MTTRTGCGASLYSAASPTTTIALTAASWKRRVMVVTIAHRTPSGCPDGGASLRKDLAWIQNAVRIERLLDPLHQRDLLRRELDGEEWGLGKPDAVLAADRAVERDD